MRTVSATLLALVMVCAVAAEEPLAFKGLAPGASKEEILRRYPRADCFATLCIMDHEKALRDMTHERAISGKLGTPIDHAAMEELSQQMSVGGVSARTIIFTLYDGKLGRISMKPRSASWGRLSQAFVDRYGKPDFDESSPIRTRAGVAYENRKMRWVQPGGQIWLERYGSTIDDSSVIYLSDDAIARLKQEANRSREKAAKDF